MLKLKLLAATLLLTLGMAFVVAPLSASAAPVTPAATTSTNPLRNTPATGTLTGALVNITGFSVVDGVINAVGTVTNAAGRVLGTFSVPVTPTHGDTCNILTLDIGAIHLNLLGLVVDLAPIHLTITGQQGTLLGGLLCGIAGLLDGGLNLNLTGITNLLNQVLGQTSALTGIAATGTVSGAFATVTKFVTQNGKLAAVTNITNAAGTLVGTATVPVTAAGSCTILTLDIGAIHLNLLGLVVDLSPVHLAITAQQGPGNLLGNLLCAIANLLHSPSLNLNGLANLLNRVLALL